MAGAAALFNNLWGDGRTKNLAAASSCMITVVQMASQLLEVIIVSLPWMPSCVATQMWFPTATKENSYSLSQSGI